jgi:hypothetical protein
MSPRGKRAFVWIVIGTIILAFVVIDLAYVLRP